MATKASYPALDNCRVSERASLRRTGLGTIGGWQKDAISAKEEVEKVQAQLEAERKKTAEAPPRVGSGAGLQLPSRPWWRSWIPNSA